MKTNATSLPCFCASYRRASRALTQLYDEALRPAGLRVTQFTILQALSLSGEIAQGDLGRLLVMDSTTLTRTLRLLTAEGWVRERRGEDRRERLVSLSRRGRQTLAHAQPHWENAQMRLRKHFGNRRWQELLQVSSEVIDGIASVGR